MDQQYYFPPVKTFWLREEIPIADELMSYAPKLLEEFLAFHDDFIEGDFAKGKPYTNSIVDINAIQTRDYAWKIEGFKYTFKAKDIYLNLLDDPDTIKRFPTAVALTKKYGDACPNSGYSILERDNIITRHTGVENRDNEYIRIHVPLLVPEGDIFFEVEGSEIDWSDLFGFDNQLVHSAHNLTNKRRLVYLIDINREYLGIPVGEKYSFSREKHCPPFVRGAKPKVFHAKQLQQNK
jgi:Aspartyl/Asparaginyl beta-hydroxylase